jgi:transcriptional regulator with XRE-family HTH domain
MPKFERVGDLIRAARAKLRLSQEQFASSLGVKLSRVQKWESGLNEPRFTITELRRLRELNRELVDALMSGFLLLEPPALTRLFPAPPAQGRALKPEGHEHP